MDQEAYGGFSLSEDDFADNPDPRVPCVLLLDTSYSMTGEPIRELNAGLVQYRDELQLDSIASRRVEIAIVTFGGDVSLEQDFVTARQFSPPTLSASGGTPMAEAIMQGVKHLEDRKLVYQQNGVAYYRPWIFLITDGEPNGSPAAWNLACKAVRLGEQQSKFTFFSVGTGDADFDKLRELGASKPPLSLRGIAFREMFRWLSNSQTRVSQSQPNDRISLPPATGDDGWADVPT